MNETQIEQQVHNFYWNENLNCTTVTLNILAEQHGITLSDQVLDAATGLHGAGKYGAQCGLVEGALLFIGILGGERDIPHTTLANLCNQFAQGFENRFGSLVCRELRPEGFAEHLPPHLCEGLTCKAVHFASCFLRAEFGLPETEAQ